MKCRHVHCAMALMLVVFSAPVAAGWLALQASAATPVEVDLGQSVAQGTGLAMSSATEEFSVTVPADRVINGSDDPGSAADQAVSGGSDTEQTILLPGDVPLVMVWIPGGTYLMGRYPDEQDSFRDEDPQHTVTVPGFWMAKHELTKRQWQAVMKSEPWSGEDYVLNDSDSPAVYVNWDDAKTFVSALNSHTGLTFRLPSEAEWEHAARAGTTTRFYWGDDQGYTEGNTHCWWTYNAWEAGNHYAHRVGQRRPNAFGLHDMSGNVSEWCEDDYHDNYAGAPADGSAWVDTPRGPYRVVRGGAWDLEGFNCRSAHRDDYDPSIRSSDIGFRLSR